MKIYNTLSRKKEDFIPIESGKLKMYVCGPTVYNFFHIGNARTFLFFDVVRRYFEYTGYDVTIVQNITDIDDKLIEQSFKENIPMPEIAGKYIKAFFEDIGKLQLNPASHYPKATEYISEMIALIKGLERQGIAYESNGDVYFSVKKFDKYGKLSGKKIDELKSGARVVENTQKHHPADFTLWKKAKPGEPNWQSPWGKGRPGWHTECVVMSRKILGETFDIHGGAIDLIFPHHENEIAQAESISKKPLSNYWMHGGFLNIAGEKMSKSLDNFFLTRDVLKKYDAEAIRFFFLSKHYRSSIDYNEDIVIESDKAVKTLYSGLKEIDFLSFANDSISFDETILSYKNKFTDAMEDDFNTAKAIAVFFEISKKIKDKNIILSVRKQLALLLVELGSTLGFFRDITKNLSSKADSVSGDLIELLISYRNQFKVEKNWKYADMIRNDLVKLGIELKDTKDGTEWSEK
jgi:cysteinyl-tRNA synthetase